MYSRGRPREETIAPGRRNRKATGRRFRAPSAAQVAKHVGGGCLYLLDWASGTWAEIRIVRNDVQSGLRRLSGGCERSENCREARRDTAEREALSGPARLTQACPPETQQGLARWNGSTRKSRVSAQAAGVRRMCPIGLVPHGYSTATHSSKKEVGQIESKVCLGKRREVAVYLPISLDVFRGDAISFDFLGGCMRELFVEISEFTIR